MDPGSAALRALSGMANLAGAAAGVSQTIAIRLLKLGGVDRASVYTRLAMKLSGGIQVSGIYRLPHRHISWTTGSSASPISVSA